jgi:hypothetical protein
MTPDWAETGYFNFYIPEANIFGFVYIVHRASVGATISDIEIVDGPGFSADDAVYIDLINHNPLVEKGEDFSLASGLSFKARSIREYEIDYQAGGVELHLDCTALMEPYDIHDPDMDPMAVADAAAVIESTGFGSAYSAHFDMTVKVVGQLRIGNRQFPIDCVSTMDHSWGPRPENGFHPILWANAHFGEGYSLHGIFSVDRDAPVGQQHVFKHGYALIDGQVRGCKGGSVGTLRPGLFPTTMEMTLIDCDDREHTVHGSVLTHHPWVPYGNNLSPITMTRWHTADGRIGIGTYLEGFPLNRIRKSFL